MCNLLLLTLSKSVSSDSYQASTFFTFADFQSPLQLSQPNLPESPSHRVSAASAETDSILSFFLYLK